MGMVSCTTGTWQSGCLNQLIYFEVGKAAWRVGCPPACPCLQTCSYVDGIFRAILEHFNLQTNSPLLSLQSAGWRPSQQGGKWSCTQDFSTRWWSCSFLLAGCCPFAGRGRGPCGLEQPCHREGQKSTVQSIAENVMSANCYGAMHPLPKQCKHDRSLKRRNAEMSKQHLYI